TSPFDLRNLLISLENQSRSKSWGKAIAFDISDNLGNHHHVKGDASRISKLLSSFLDSTAKFAANGTIQLVASAEPSPSGRCRFRLEAESSSIDADAIETSLAPLALNRSLSLDEVANADLGLAVCKKLSQMFDGDIGIDRLSNGRIIFRLDINLLLDEHNSGSACHSSPPVSAEQQNETKLIKNILVAEDNPDMAILIEDLLDEAGYQSTVAPDGASVLRILDEQQFDVVLMDGRMPDMSGFETTDRIRQLPDERADLPIIALTAEALAGDRERYLAGGMDGYVPKPINYETLVETIEDCCRRR
ncbi:MAG: response regulator, partial [Geminicoccaceae bacterium]